MTNDDDEDDDEIVMTGVREYAEGYQVTLLQAESWREPSSDGPRWCVRALNQGGHDATQVDILDLIRWLREHRPELLAP